MNDISLLEKLNKICEFEYYLNKEGQCEKISFHNESHILENTIRKHPRKRNIVNLMSQLPNLKHVNLRKSKIGFIPNFASNKIEHLDISCNDILDVKEINKKNFPEMKHLNLGSNLVRVIPDLSELKLDTLKIHKNPITDLPNVPSKIKNLNAFFTYKLKKIPKEIFKLEFLESLSLGFSDARYPIDFSNLKNLKWLIMSSNNLNEFPESILDCRNIEGILMPKNKINMLPKEIGVLKNLKTISMYKNNISQIPDSFYDIKLKRISFKNNPIEDSFREKIKKNFKNSEVEI